MVKEYVLPSYFVFADEHKSYTRLEEIQGKNYHHLRIKHEAKVYVMGQVHTQTIEGFWTGLLYGEARSQRGLRLGQPKIFADLLE